MLKKFDDTLYALADGVKTAKATSYSKFPGSIELHLALKLPKEKEAKSVKGTLTLPSPLEMKDSRIIVFCEKEAAEAAKKAGAVDAGLDDLVKKIQDGWSEFDVALATADVMAKIAVLGKELGPKGLMPNPKTGTLVTNVEKAIGEFKKGKTKFSCDEGSVVHVVVGKADTEDQKIVDNVKYSIAAVAEVIGKPQSLIVKTVTLSSTMGPGVRINPESAC